MRRDIEAIAGRAYDLVIVGGGIFGACAAWDAAQRGLSVALFERDDFCGATSANSYKIVHGGIRYLQHADLARIRQSSNERRAFLRIAPHLVAPRPIVIPTYGRALRGRLFLRLGSLLYDLLVFDRNRGIRDPSRRVPLCSSIDRDAVLGLFPDLDSEDLTGAVVFSDGQLLNPPRLVWAVIESAASLGAAVANHAEVRELLVDRKRIGGVRVLDRLSGDEHEIRARFVLNAAGPYAETLLERSLGIRLRRPGTYSRDACFVVATKVGDGEHGLALLGGTRDPDAVVSRGARHLFLTPWRGRTLVGVWHRVYDGDPERITVGNEELGSFLRELDDSCSLEISLRDVEIWNAGLVPFGENEAGAADLRYGHRSQLVDHQIEHGLDGLFTLIGVRFTTGRSEAANAIERIGRRLGRTLPPSRTASTPVVGGDIPSLAELLRRAQEERPRGLAASSAAQLVMCYGTDYRRVTAHGRERPELLETLGTSDVIGAQVVHAIQHELAHTLADVVCRRTDLATGWYPGRPALARAAELAGELLGWSERRQQEEVAIVERRFRDLPRYSEEIRDHETLDDHEPSDVGPG